MKAWDRLVAIYFTVLAHLYGVLWTYTVLEPIITSKPLRPEVINVFIFINNYFSILRYGDVFVYVFCEKAMFYCCSWYSNSSIKIAMPNCLQLHINVVLYHQSLSHVTHYRKVPQCKAVYLTVWGWQLGDIPLIQVMRHVNGSQQFNTFIIE